MKYEIMIKILFLLLSKGKVSAKYIAQRFDVSTRTVMRYLDAMSLANVPVIADPGRNGGFYIADSYKLPASFMTEKEFNAVIATLKGYNESVQSKAIESAIDKLSSIKKPAENLVDVKTGNLIIDGSSWHGNDNARNVASIISNAIDDCKKTVIGYVDGNGKETVRKIEPHVIILKQGVWYVYAFCNMRNAFRMFKLSRMTFADVKDETFEKRRVDLSALTTGRWFENLESELVRLQIEKSAKSEIEEWLGVNSVFSSSGQLIAEVSLPVNNWLISKILSFGSKVKVLAPASLKDGVLRSAKEVFNLY
ncbi:MAG: YafY family transcriptional regulator [Clostridia bacterium]|nr:YafY family transcriptional regulator [Clostridia bacterium]